MLSPCKRTIGIASTALAMGLLCAGTTLAQKGGKGGGKGGGGSEPEYAIIELPRIDPDAEIFFPLDISDPNPVTGEVIVVGHEDPSDNVILWRVTSDGQLLETLYPGLFSPDTATGVNSLAQIVGYTDTVNQYNNTAAEAVFWDSATTTLLGRPFGGAQSAAFDINASGLVVGQEYGPSRGVLWQMAADGTVADSMDLGTFAPLRINQFAQMCGHVDGVPAVAELVDGVLDVITLPLEPGDGEGYATRINDRFEVCGYRMGQGSWKEGGARGFYWSPATGLLEIGNLGLDNTVPQGIGGAGAITGYSHKKNHDRRAFVWRGGVMDDLNKLIASDLGTVLIEGFGANNAEQLIVRGGPGDGSGWHLYLLTPLAP